MTERSSQQKLVPIWQQHRNRILSYGHALHALLPDGDPPVTIHGRELRPEDEGVGFQFQYVLTSPLYNGDVASACYVVHIQLVPPQRTSIGVRVDAAPLLEYGDGHFEVFGQSGTTLPIGDKRGLRDFFGTSLTQSMSRFFTSVRAGEPIEEATADQMSTSQVSTQ